MKGKDLFHFLLSLVLVFLIFPSPSYARIKLVALPDRGATTIRLDNPLATLIQEERILTLQKGINKVDFSWKGVHLDEDSIRMTVLSHPYKATLLGISYPPDESALVWEIYSDDAFEVTVKITYLLSFIDRRIAYKAIADKDEAHAIFKSFLILRNFSGEDFQDVSVLLEEGRTYKQNIKHGETKQVLVLEKMNVPIEKRWTFDADKCPWDPEKLDINVGIPVTYVFRNSKEKGLGQGMISDGKVRVFQEDGHQSTIFLGEDRTDRVPIGEKMEVYIGDSRDIVVTQRKMYEKRINVRRNSKHKIVLYDTDELIRSKIENFKDKPALLTLIQHIPGQWDMETCNRTYTRKDAFTLAFEIALPAKSKQELVMHYHRRNVR